MHNNENQTMNPKPAAVGLRFVNHMIDRIAMFAIVMIGAGIVAGLMRHAGRHHGAFAGAGLLLMAVLYVGYYLFFEGLWQRTPGKWVTGTKVVREDGSAPSFVQIMGRTFARCIPFDVFSFLGMNVAGWHDRFSGTLVVSDKLSAEQVRMIDAEQYRKVNVLAAVIVGLFLMMLGLGLFAAGIASSMHEHRSWNRGETMDGGQYYNSDMDGYGQGFDQTAPSMMDGTATAPSFQ